MRRLLLFMIPLLFLFSACASGIPASEPPGVPFLVTVTGISQPAIVPQEPAASAPPTASPTTSPALPASTLQAAVATVTLRSVPPSLTPGPSFTQVLPTPTETLLPPLDLPTEKPLAPALVAWTGLPTYLGDSDPGRLFRVDYDPDLWAQTESNFGEIVLANRQIEYCTITPWSGRGLPVDWKVTHEFRYIGSASFDVNIVTYQGVVKFVTYVGGDRRVLTGFQVSFNDQSETCLQHAEAIFGTLRSYAAVPTSTPIEPTLSATPTP